MTDKIYTLKQHPRTNEYHLFIAKPTDDNRCIPEKKSMCQAMERVDGSKFACEEEADAFRECAKLGRQVCGNCMKELYSSEE